METKITLPTIEQLRDKIILTDWEIDNGAAIGDTCEINGEMKKSGKAWSCEFCSSEFVFIRGHRGRNTTYDYASSSGVVARPLIKNPELLGLATTMVGEEEALTVYGKTVPAPKTKITEKIKIIGPIDLSFRSASASLKVGEDSYTPKASNCYEVIVNDRHGYAVKHVKDMETTWHWLEPLPAKKQENGDIQIYNGLPQQFEVQSKYERKTVGLKRGTELNTDDFQIGKAMKDMMQEWIKSAEVIASITALKKTEESMDELAARLINKGVTDIKTAGAILTTMLEQRMNSLQDIKQAEAFEKFIDNDVLAEKNGRPAWESSFNKLLQAKNADLLGSKKKIIANKIGLIKKQPEIKKENK